MADLLANTSEKGRNSLSQPTHLILKSKNLAPSRSPISGWIFGDRYPPVDGILGEYCFYSHCLVLAGYRLRWNEAASELVLSFSAVFSRCEQQVYNLIISRADCESSVTCMEVLVRLGMSCGCIWSTATMGGAGWGEPAGQLGCSQAGLWAWDVGERCELCGRSLHGHPREQKPYNHLNPWKILHQCMRKCSNRCWNCITPLLAGMESPARGGGVFSRAVSGKMLLTRRSCEKSMWIWNTGPAEGRSFHGTVSWEMMSFAEYCAFPSASVQSHDDSAKSGLTVFGNSVMPETALLLNKINLIKHRHCLNRSDFRSAYSRLLCLRLMRPFKDSGGK